MHDWCPEELVRMQTELRARTAVAALIDRLDELWPKEVERWIDRYLARRIDRGAALSNGQSRTSTVSSSSNDHAN